MKARNDASTVVGALLAFCFHFSSSLFGLYAFLIHFSSTDSLALEDQK